VISAVIFYIFIVYWLNPLLAQVPWTPQLKTTALLTHCRVDR